MSDSLKSERYKALKELAFQGGVTAFGVAQIKDILPKYPLLPAKSQDTLIYGISVGIALSQVIVDEIVDQPTKLYFYHYRRVNIALDQVAILITNYIQRQKHQALPIPSSQVVNWEKQLGTISHKEVAVKAGLGWIGRNNLLVNPDFGAAMRYITILTDLPLTTDTPAQQGCAECRDCLSVCPANAIKESAADFDHLACFEKLKQFSKQCNIGHYICGICVKACTGERINNAKEN